MSDHPQDLGLREQAASIASGELDATELLDATLERIEQRNGALNAIVDVAGNEAAQMLAEAPDGPLHGVPIAIKDMYALPWRAPRDGAVKSYMGVEAGESAMYRRLRDAGAVIVGVTNTHELGLGSTGHISAYGPVGNPWDHARCAGGSSGGSASAVGARLVAGAIGNDGGGSVRFPAGYCGITGIKLTWGSVPNDGYTFRKSLLGSDGPFGRDAADTRLLASAMLGTPLGDRRTDGLRIGVPEFFWDDLDPEVEAACRQGVASLEQADLLAESLDLLGTDYLRIATVLLLGMELSPDAKPGLLEEILPQLDPLLRGLTKFQMLVPAPAYIRAAWVRSELRRSLAEAFDDVDLLAFPTLPAPAPLIENPSVELPSGVYPADFANVRQGGLANLTGVPAISIPCGFSASGLPIGLQLVAPWGEEERLLDVAETFERASAREFIDPVPPIAQQAAV